MKHYSHSHADHHKPQPKKLFRGLSRKQKDRIQLLMIIIIGALLIHEGSGYADWGFLGLALLAVELS